MKKIVSIAGFMLTYVLDILDKQKRLDPIFIGLDQEDKEFKKIFNGISLEQTIPKAVSMFERNSQNAKAGIVIYPAEMEDTDNKRYSVIILMIKNYENNDYIMLSQPYSFEDSKLKVEKFELLDYSPFILESLKELEEFFINGALNYDNAEYIWSQRFKAS